MQLFAGYVLHCFGEKLDTLLTASRTCPVMCKQTWCMSVASNYKVRMLHVCISLVHAAPQHTQPDRERATCQHGACMGAWVHAAPCNAAMPISPGTHKGVGTLTRGTLADSDAQGLGGQAHGTLHLQVLVLSTLDQVIAHCELYTAQHA